MVMDRNMFEADSVIYSDSFVCGYFDSDAGESYRDFVVKGMTGYGEDYLGGKGEILSRVNSFILDSIVSVGPIVDKDTLSKIVYDMPTADRLIAMIAIRIATHGRIYKMVVEMPADSDKPQGRFSVDLMGLSRNVMKDPSVRNRTDRIKLIRSGEEEPYAEYEIDWHVMRGRDENWQQVVSDRTGKESDMTLKILCRLDSIGRVASDGSVDKVEIKRGRVDGESRQLTKQLKDSIGFVKSFPGALRNSIRNVFDKNEGDVDLKLDFDYVDKSGVKKVFSSRLDPTQRGFFFPEET